MRLIYLFLILPILVFGEINSLKERLLRADPGDYIVTEQDRTLSLLHLHSRFEDQIILEEINLPESLFKAKKLKWKKWVAEGAKGHSSWTHYLIDLKKGKMLECFSYTKQAWLTFREEKNFLTELLSLELTPTAEKNLRKVGPRPPSSEIDYRKTWYPPKVYEGKKLLGSPCDVYDTRWPEDESELSGKKLLLYFDRSDFPFPYWMQIAEGARHVRIRAMDSGKGMESPKKEIPKRSPNWIGSPKYTTQGLELKLESPPYFEHFELYVIDISSHPRKTLLVPFKQIEEEKHFKLMISKATLSDQLTSGHLYHFVAKPTNSNHHFAETHSPTTLHFE